MRFCCIPNFEITRVGAKQYAERHTITFLDEISADLGEVVICAPEVFKHNHSQIHGCDLTKYKGITKVTRKWSSKYKRTFYALSVLWLLPQIIRSDFLYIFMPGRLGVIAAFLAVVIRRPYGIYLRGSDVDLFGVKFSLSKAKFVLATGKLLRDIAAKYCDNCDIVSPMLDIGTSDLQLNRIQRQHNGKWQLLYVGSLEDEKGTPELLDAIEILRARGRAVELNLVGNWIDKQSGCKIETEKGSYGALKFHGPINDRSQVKQFFLDSDLFVFPSHSEGFPRVLYEAMCFGLPIVTTMVDGIPYVMQANVNCMAVPVGEANSLANAIGQALDDIALRKKFAANGLSTMRDIFDKNKKSHALQVVERVQSLRVGDCIRSVREHI